jgi:cytoskeleton protein RodZ
MSELNLSGHPVDGGAANEGTVLTAGLILRNSREAAGLHVAALAVSMKIPVKKLEALESDRLDLLHDAVFVRALAASVCRTLKIDSAPVLAKLPLNSATRLNSDERGINAPFHPAGERKGLSVPTFLTKPSVMLVFLLLAGIIAIFLFPEKKVAEVVSEQSLQKPTLVTHSEPTPLELPVAPSSDAVPTSIAVVPISVNDNGGTNVISPQVPRNALSSPQPAQPNGIASSPELSTSGAIVFKAKAASWVKVIDSTGSVRLSKTLTDGEVASATGLAPLSVVVGRADVVDVEVHGKPFSLIGVAKENVARFEVK